MRYTPLLLLLSISCFNPPTPDPGLFCDDDEQCPPDQTCDPDNRCVWDGGSTCDIALQCPDPDSDKVTICGTLWDAVTANEIRNSEPTGLACDTVGPTAIGACAVKVKLYDSSAYLADPDGASPLVTAGDIGHDDCGRFIAHNVTRPTNGKIAVEVEDVDGGPGGDVYARTAITYEIDAASTESGAIFPAVDNLSVAQWSSDAGDRFMGGNFAEVGVSLPVFLYQGEPVADVIVEVNTGDVAADAYYFSDADPYTHKSVDPLRTETGANGSALVINQPVSDFTGSGSEPDGCVWTTVRSASTPGLIHYAPLYLEVDGQPDEYCD